MPDKIDKIFKAIADPTRREILHALVVASVAMPITEIWWNWEIIHYSDMCRPYPKERLMPYLQAEGLTRTLSGQASNANILTRTIS